MDIDHGSGNQVGRAAALLAWQGVLLEDMVLFGQRVAVVAELDPWVHQARLAAGWGPVTDRMSVALWQACPDQHADVPPAAVRLVGFLARGTRWQRALAAVGGFVGFGSTAVLLDQDRPPNQHCLITAHLHGVAVLRHHSTSGDVHLVQAGRSGPVPTARPSTVSRWVQELVYQRIVDDRVEVVSS